LIMSTNSANQVPPSRGTKKRTTRTVLSSMTSEDIFKAMDLPKSASADKYIPKQERGGNGGMESFLDEDGIPVELQGRQFQDMDALHDEL
jgi:hypothetical protein